MAGINGLVTVPLVASGVEIDNDQITIGGNLRYRQRTRIAGFLEAELTDVRDTTPGASDYGVVVRNIPSGTQDVAGTVAISGTVPVSGTVAISGTVTVTGTVAISGTVPVSISGTVPISAASLPLPTGAATEAKQPSVGTAGTASGNVITIQGIASMTPVLVNGSGFTQPVSGTVGISGTVPVSGTVAISGTVPISAAALPLPTGAASDAGLAALLAELQFKADLAETQPVAIAPLTSCGSGKTTVTTAGTRVALGASTAIKSVTVKALISNTGLIYIGNTTVAAANGFQLSAGDPVSLDVDNLTDINIDSAVSGEGVSYIWAT